MCIRDRFETAAHEQEAARIEQRQYDDWMERQERAAAPQDASPWHHDEDQIWQFEDNLRKGRT